MHARVADRTADPFQGNVELVSHEPKEPEFWPGSVANRSKVIHLARWRVPHAIPAKIRNSHPLPRMSRKGVAIAFIFCSATKTLLGICRVIKQHSELDASVAELRETGRVGASRVEVRGSVFGRKQNQ